MSLSLRVAVIAIVGCARIILLDSSSRMSETTKTKVFMSKRYLFYQISIVLEL